MQYDVRHRLHELRAPTLFLAADRDHLVPSVAQAVLEGHGHICLIAPDIDLEALLNESRGAG
jgi:3-oxoadipate enol-lactonase